MALVHAPHASAQHSELDTRAHGAGLRLGDLLVQPELGAQTGWVSNVFLSDDPEPSAALRVTPRLLLTTMRPEPQATARRALDFEALIQGALKHYFESEAQTDVAIDQAVRLALRPGANFKFDLFQEFQRSIDPFTDPLPPALGVDVTSYARDRLSAGARAQVSTQGEVLRAGLGYRFDLDHFEDAAFRDDRNRKHTFGADVAWAFYPRTALFWSANLGLFEYSDVGPVTRVSRRESTHLDSRVGFHGALTQRLSATAALGYAAALPANEHDHDTVIGQLELRLRVQETLAWSIGCERMLGPAFQGDFASVNRVKTKLDVKPRPSLLLSLRADVDFIEFGRDEVLASVGAESERDDILLRTGVTADYAIMAWWLLTAEVSYVHNFSDFVFPVPDSPGDEAAYAQLQGWAGIRFVL